MPTSTRPILTIDLKAVSANFKILEGKLRRARCGAATKADCYGLGMREVAPALYATGCRDFFVANIEEGIALREILPGAAIFVLLGPSRSDRGLYARYALAPVLNSLDQVEEWLFRKKPERAMAVALHLDTGMARLGMPSDQGRELVESPHRLAKLNIALVMSHLACAEERRHPLNTQQLHRFREFALPFANHAANRPRLSLAASSGIFLGASYEFDLARPGAALYGLNPVPGRKNPMRPVVSLHAPIVQERWIGRGQTVGYGATYKSKGRTRVATIPLGYADGVMRAFGRTGCVWIGAHQAPVIGRVSMDLLTIDVTAIPERLTKPGAMVEILGQRQDADEFGRRAGTIGYEVLTALGRRYQRRYLALE